MRAGRRGMREMDLILAAWAETRLDAAGPERLDLFEELLDESDQDLFAWVAGQSAPPARYADLVAELGSAISGRAGA
ncbi:succinate dehydrogenase assembly factor 2 [Rhodobacterales bacterium HKCCE2091]|nr:succinate dehydrogenase assembly factor 2 [Rhodobacterales bacterium HKCCE2091]